MTYAAIPKGITSVRPKVFKLVPFCEAYRCHRISTDAVPELAKT